MNQRLPREQRVLSIYPSVHGFGFAVFEGPRHPIDWGVRYVRTDKNQRSRAKVADLIAWYEPHIVLVRDPADPVIRRHRRVRLLARSIRRAVEWRGISVRCFGRPDIRRCFAAFGARNKHEIARRIAEWMPEFRRTVPPKRKIWMPQDPRMGVFDAVALVMTYVAADGDHHIGGRR